MANACSSRLPRRSNLPPQPAFDGLSAGAMWEDTKIGVEHWGGWKRTAVVTDIDWMANALAWFGWMSPGEIKHFALAERDAAIAWAAG